MRAWGNMHHDRRVRVVMMRALAACCFAAALFNFRRHFFPLFLRSSAASLEATTLLKKRALGVTEGLRSPGLLYENVTRSSEGMLYMAFYFPQYHIAPENKMQLKVKESHYTDWDVLKANSRQSSLTPTQYYSLANASVFDEQDALANKYGIGAFIFYHYWLDNTMVLNLPVDLFIRKGRKTKFLFCWDNTSGFMGKQLYDNPEKHGYQLLRYFLDENYLTDVDGRKPFIVYLSSSDSARERYTDVQYLLRLIKFLESLGVRLKLGHNYQERTNEWELPEWSEIASEFGPHLGVGKYRESNLYVYSPRDPRWSTGREYWQGATSSWDSRPRCKSGRTRQKDCGGAAPNGLVSPTGFGRLLQGIRENIHPLNRDRVVTLFAWNEWAEGAALEESVEFGTSFLEQLL